MTIKLEKDINTKHACLSENTLFCIFEKTERVEVETQTESEAETVRGMNDSEWVYSVKNMGR